MGLKSLRNGIKYRNKSGNTEYIEGNVNTEYIEGNVSRPSNISTIERRSMKFTKSICASNNEV